MLTFKHFLVVKIWSESLSLMVPNILFLTKIKYLFGTSWVSFADLGIQLKLRVYLFSFTCRPQIWEYRKRRQKEKKEHN